MHGRAESDNWPVVHEGDRPLSLSAKNAYQPIGPIGFRSDGPGHHPPRRRPGPDQRRLLDADVSPTLHLNHPASKAFTRRPTRPMPVVWGWEPWSADHAVPDGEVPPMIHPRYHEAFCALSQEELTCCISGLRAARPGLPEITDPEEFLGFCIAEHISQAEVVMGLAKQHTVHAVTATERLIMKPIDRRTASEVEAERRAAAPRAIAAPVRAREATTDQRIIRLLVESNPKRAGSAGRERFALYRDGMTVAQFLAAGGTRADLIWDQEHAFIRLEAEQQAAAA